MWQARRMWRVLLLVSAVASAEPASCPKPAGKVVFEIDQRADRPRQVTGTSKLWANGVWKDEVFDVDGKRMRWNDGCLDAESLATIRASLKAATWKPIDVEPKCTSDSPRFTIYKYEDRAVFTDRPCSKRGVDPDSRRLLDTLEYWISGTPAHWPNVERCLANPLAKGCN